MKGKLFVIFAALIVSAVQPQKTYASPIAYSSATFTTNTTKVEADNRVKLLKKYLATYSSPLENEAETFVVEADKYHIDYKLIPAIAGNESCFGNLVPTNSYNAWGWGVYANRVTYFTSWKEAIHTISKEMRERYMNSWGAKNIEDIGKIYAADPGWARKVKYFYNDMVAFETKEQNKTISISL